MAKKMALIPIEMLGRLKGPNLTPLTNPNRDQVIKKMDEVSSILQDETLPESIKASRINEKVKNYSVFADKLLTPSKSIVHETTDNQEELFNSLPNTFRPPAMVLMEELKKHPQAIKWSPNGEVSVQGTQLRGSNIVDLIGHVLRSRKTTQVPVHGDAFLKVLADLNFPEELVKNKYQLSKFRSYKQGEEGVPLRKVAAPKLGAKRRLVEAVKKGRKLKKKYQWQSSI
jgi:hypothetical protein